MEFAWPDVFVDEGNIKVHIRSLRHALRDTHPRITFIATVVGRGYQFVYPVRTARIDPPFASAPALSGNVYGYARVSPDQDLGAQEAALRAAGCDIIRAEKVTGTTREMRTELASLLDCMRPGDILCVTRIDRLAQSIGDLARIVSELETLGVSLRVTQQSIDTSTVAGSAFLGMLGVIAEFEANLHKERQLEGHG